MAVACIVTVLAVLIPHAEARAQAGLANLPAITPAMNCADVASLNLAGVTDGTVTITSATAVSAGTTVAQFTTTAPACAVAGIIGPGTNEFELLLPTQGWTQRYLQAGCGGLCGNIGLTPTEASTCVPVTNGQIAMAATDMGHEGNYLPNSTTPWETDPQAKIDFAYRGQHATAEVAKAIIAQFYGQAARYAYFDGCSDGGREALMEAQRFPDDFDGIAAGAPANDLLVLNTYHHAWNNYEIVASLKDTSGNVTRTRPVFPYPMVARYTGSGSTNDAANFVAYTPPTEPYVSSSWIGQRLYSPGYEQWCDVSGGQLICTGPVRLSNE